MDSNNIKLLLEKFGDANLDSETVYRYRDLIRVIIAVLKDQKLIE